MSGYYLMHRGWLDHPVFTGDRYCRRAAWAYLIENAAWAPRRRSIQGKTIELRRGQLSASLRFLAQAWGWTEPSVRRYLTRLKTDALIDARADAGQLVITILNYDKYQAAPKAPDAPSDAADDAEATHERRSSDANYKEINSGNSLNESSVPYGTAPAGPLDLKAEIFRRGKAYLTANRIPEKQAGSMLGKWRRDHGDAALIDALARAEAESASDPIPFIEAILRRSHESRRADPAKPDRFGSLLAGASAALDR